MWWDGRRNKAGPRSTLPRFARGSVGMTGLLLRDQNLEMGAGASRAHAPIENPPKTAGFLKHKSNLHAE